MYIFKRLFFVQPPLKSINAERMNGSTKLYWRYYKIKKKKGIKGDGSWDKLSCVLMYSFYNL